MLDALAFDLAEVGQGDGVAKSFGSTRRPIYLDELRERLSREIVLCCSPERNAVLKEVLKRYQIELVYDRTRKNIGILEPGQKVIIIEPYNIEGANPKAEFPKLLLERDFHDLDQVSKARFRFWEYTARDFVYQSVLEQRFPWKK